MEIRVNPTKRNSIKLIGVSKKEAHLDECTACGKEINNEIEYTINFTTLYRKTGNSHETPILLCKDCLLTLHNLMLESFLE